MNKLNGPMEWNSSENINIDMKISCMIEGRDRIGSYSKVDQLSKVNTWCGMIDNPYGTIERDS